MTWLQKLVELFYSDDTGFIYDNIYIFITYGIICLGIALAINKGLNNHLKLKYEKASDQINGLKAENAALKAENQALKEIYEKYEELPRLMMGTAEDFSCPSADLISNDINRSSSKNTKILKKLFPFMKTK